LYFPYLFTIQLTFLRNFHTSTPAAAAAAIHTYPRAAAAAVIPLKFHPKHVTNKNKAKHIMKISHIKENMYGNYEEK
jgi:hypothetical protein